MTQSVDHPTSYFCHFEPSADSTMRQCRVAFSTMNFLTRIPAEILLEIGDHLYDDLPALGSLAACNRRFNEVFEPVLYKANIQQCTKDSETRQSLPRSLAFAAWNDVTSVLNKTTAAMAAMACFLGDTAITIDQMGEIPAALGLRGKGTALHVAGYRGSNNVVRALLAMGADANLLSSGICKDFNRRAWRPLHFALCQGHSSTANILIQAGARYAMSNDTPHNDGRGVIGVIHSACSHRAHDKPLFELLYRTARKGQGDWGEEQHGPMAGFFNRRVLGGSPIDFTILTSHQQGTKQLSNLIKWGADIHTKSAWFPPCSALEVAILEGMWAAARVLFSQGAKLEYSGNDPTRQASRLLFQLLNDSFPGSDWCFFRPNCSKGYYYGTNTTLSENEAAVWRTERWELIKTLIAHYHIDINNVFWWSGRLLSTALFFGLPHRLELIPFMVTQLGADLTRPDRKGRTILYVLARSFNFERSSYRGTDRRYYQETDYNAFASTICWVVGRIGWAWMEVDDYIGDKKCEFSPLRIIITEPHSELRCIWSYYHRLRVIDLFLGYERFTELQPIAFQDFVEARAMFLRKLQQASTTPQGDSSSSSMASS